MAQRVVGGRRKTRVPERLREVDRQTTAVVKIPRVLALRRDITEIGCLLEQMRCRRGAVPRPVAELDRGLEHDFCHLRPRRPDPSQLITHVSELRFERLELTLETGGVDGLEDFHELLHGRPISALHEVPLCSILR